VIDHHFGFSLPVENPLRMPAASVGFFANLHVADVAASRSRTNHGTILARRPAPAASQARAWLSATGLCARG
jgi:hypothetical protein